MGITGTGGSGPGTPGGGIGGPGFRPATPNRRGQYSDAVLSELESQNDAHVEGILGKVKVLKDVSASTLYAMVARRGGREVPLC